MNIRREIRTGSHVLLFAFFSTKSVDSKYIQRLNELENLWKDRAVAIIAISNEDEAVTPKPFVNLTL
jgi:hypothetical protein